MDPLSRLRALRDACYGWLTSEVADTRQLVYHTQPVDLLTLHQAHEVLRVVPALLDEVAAAREVCSPSFRSSRDPISRRKYLDAYAAARRATDEALGGTDGK